MRNECLGVTASLTQTSRHIAVDMYNALIALRPDWPSYPNDDDAVAAVCDRRTNPGENSNGHRPPLQEKVEGSETS
jgi:hypothetical protein